MREFWITETRFPVLGSVERVMGFRLLIADSWYVFRPLLPRRLGYRISNQQPAFRNRFT